MEETVFTVYAGLVTATLCGVIFGALIYALIRARHRVRVVRAQLNLADLVTRKSERMAEASIRRHPNCDWALFRFMVSALYDKEAISSGWHPFQRVSPNAREIRRQLTAEIQRDNELFRGILNEFEAQCWQIYRFSHPVRYWFYLISDLVSLREVSEVWQDLQQKWSSQVRRLFGIKDMWSVYRSRLSLLQLAIQVDLWEQRSMSKPSVAVDMTTLAKAGSIARLSAVT